MSVQKNNEKKSFSSYVCAVLKTIGIGNVATVAFSDFRRNVTTSALCRTFPKFVQCTYILIFDLNLNETICRTLKTKNTWI